MLVVSNTSPITNLAAVGQLDLLRLLYGTIIIPEAVYNELVLQGGPNNPGAAEVQAGLWIETRKVTDTALVQRLMRPNLAAGELEALVLAIELNADLLLLDEKQARNLAGQSGLTYTGVLGVLLEAKTAGLIPLIRPLLDVLRGGPGFRLSDTLYIETLRRGGSGLETAGEARARRSQWLTQLMNQVAQPGTMRHAPPLVVQDGGDILAGRLLGELAYCTPSKSMKPRSMSVAARRTRT